MTPPSIEQSLMAARKRLEKPPAAAGSLFRGRWLVTPRNAHHPHTRCKQEHDLGGKLVDTDARWFTLSVRYRRPPHVTSITSERFSMNHSFDCLLHKRLPCALGKSL
jgi:hypothetical protein